jgi:hypothetical protein
VGHVGPYQPLLILTILFGSSMAVWGSSGTSIAVHSTILGNGSQSMACSCFPYLATSLHLGCSWPVPFPLDVPVLFGNTWVGFTWGDFVAGLIDIAIQCAIEVATLAVGSLLKKVPFSAGLKLLKGFVAKAAEETAEEAAEKAESKVVQEAMEESWTAAKIGRRASLTELDDVVDTEVSESLEASDSRIESLIHDARYAEDDAVEEVVNEEEQTVIRKESVSIAEDAAGDAANDADEVGGREASYSASVVDDAGERLDEQIGGKVATEATTAEKLAYMAKQTWLEYVCQISERGCEIGNSHDEGVDDDQFEVFAYWQPLGRDVVINAVSGEDEEDDRFQSMDD